LVDEVGGVWTVSIRRTCRVLLFDTSVGFPGGEKSNVTPLV